MKYINNLFLCVLLSVASVSEASSLFVDKHIKNKEVAFLAKVLAAEMLEFPFGGQIHECGFNYIVRVLLPIKGKVVTGSHEVFSSFPLLIGEEYLLALNIPPVTSKSLVEWPRNYKSAFSKCEKKIT